MLASYNGRKEIVEMLLQAGANIEAKNKVSSSSSLCLLSDGYRLAVVVTLLLLLL